MTTTNTTSRPCGTNSGTDDTQELIYQSHESSKSELHDQWYSDWIFASHSSQIPANGDYITVQAGHYPVILVRNNDAEIVALNNSCRHRGSRVCQQDKGNAPNLVCPYHQWTYDLNGQLVFARNMMDEINIDEFPLKKFAVAEHDGFVFVHLTDEDAVFAGVDDSFKKTLSDLSLSDIDQWSSAADYRQQVDAHWDEAESFVNDAAECLYSGKSISIWQAPDHIAIIRQIPLNLYQTEISIQCLVAADSVMGRDYHDQALMEQWGVTDYQSSIIVTTETDPDEQHQANMEFAEKYGLEAPVLRHNDMDYNDMFSEHRTWDSSAQELVCTMVVDETENVKTYTFKTDGNSWFKFKPGQFVTLSLPTEDGPVLRTYTISSTPSRPFSLSVTVKVQPDSTGTRWLFENVKPGDILKAYGPAGEFSFFNQPSDKYLFISAGSGITPMMSMTRWMFDYGYDMDVNFISCVNTPQDILFREELENVAGRCPNFRLSWVCAEDTKYNAWTGLRGRFNKLILGLTAPDYMDRDVYCCGPAPFMKAVRDALDASGFDMARYHEESFGAPDTSNQEDQFPDGAEIVHVNFGKSDKSREVSQRETLLDAAKAADIAIPSACGFGVCGTCKVKVVSGETHMVHSGGISQKEIDQGYVLACCTNPITNTEIAL
ncbi:Rieske 2Fe-2S domain-containing protein [Aliamphritea ceti]|uniref:Rieske 2Fe-2S domain-containing protein n=1 Tax=Aliamphritea ceti TaxID=1524258 RepID=UPI0021C32C01|nr:Rieske 2Fe-2S domain-containing protein [Aliamphritea ceti]